MGEVQFKLNYQGTHFCSSTTQCFTWPQGIIGHIPNSSVASGPCSGTRSIQMLLGGDPASTLLSSVLLHRPELTPSLLPPTGGGQLMALRILRFFQPAFILGENQPVVGLSFPKLSSSLFLMWNIYLFIQFQIL